MEFALWNRSAVRQLIEQEYGIKLHVRSVGKYLACWGFTSPKPIKKADEQRLEAVRRWLNEQYKAFFRAECLENCRRNYWSVECFCESTLCMSFSTGSHRTSVRTELAMKHSSCARWCKCRISLAVGSLSPEKFASGRRITTDMTSLPSSAGDITPLTLST